jgi:hypothetical protein
MAYLLDTNVFIAAKNLHYGLDFCPGFWDWLVREHRAGVVLSVEKVGDELVGLGDDLSAWAEARGSAFFRPPDARTLAALAEVAAWATTSGYAPSAINAFLQDADYYLVADARAGDHVVVTHEIASNSKKKIKIPDACISLGIKCMQPFQMLRLQHAKFVL